MALAIARTKDGHPAVQLRHMTWAMMPTRSGFGLFTLYPGRPPEELTVADFRDPSTPIADEAAFVAYVQGIYDHWEQVDALGRRELDRPISTPWGLSQTRTRYAEGIESVTTASHGGFILEHEQNELIHPLWRESLGYYEEDCAWAVVAHHFPGLFTSREKGFAERTLRSTYPDEFEAITGQKVLPGESYSRDRKLHLEANADRYVTISAINSKTVEGMVEVTATIGGHPSSKAVTFLVPKAEYQIGLGFVIDESRHPRLIAEAA